MNVYKGSFGSKKLALLVTVCMLLTSVLLNTQPSLAATFKPAANGTGHVKQQDPALIITGQGATRGDGFTGNYKYLTQDQMKSIKNDASAKKYFGTEDTVYLQNQWYSGQTKAAQGGWGRYQISGLNLKSVAASMGIDTTKALTIRAKGQDGHNSSLNDIFQNERYSFDTSSAQTGTPVPPAIALEGEDLELPRLVIGQTSPGDYNMQNWEKWVKSLWIGGVDEALTLTINGEKKTYSLADIIGTKSGSYTSEYAYTDGGNQVRVKAVGIPLNLFLKDAEVSGNYTIKTNSGKLISDPSKYLLAYDAKTESGTSIKSTGSLILYGPGTTKSEVVTEKITGITLSVSAPAAVTGLKAVNKAYNKIGLSWKKTSGAEGYNIYRYNSKTKKYSLLDCVEGANRISYTDTGLNPGSKYYYRVRAYKTVSGMDLEGGYSNTASAKPILGKTKTKLSKSGKNAIKVKWSKVAGASGYQVRMGTNKKITKGKKTYNIKKGSQVSKKVTKLKKGKHYYAKVRAYRNVSGKKVYGAYSSVKSIKR